MGWWQIYTGEEEKVSNGTDVMTASSLVGNQTVLIFSVVLAAMAIIVLALAT